MLGAKQNQAPVQLYYTDFEISPHCGCQWHNTYQWYSTLNTFISDLPFYQFLQMDFFNENIWISLGSNCKYSSIGYDKGLVPTSPQRII